mmetsp:Transcript_5570/g.10052  ORF Transcript_5570/g.10052 Transcript_5570/m.10052 type:complete len:489 (-) Transcript_5570:2935-4401(-)
MRMRPHSLPSPLKLSHVPDMKCHATITRATPCVPTISFAAKPCGKLVFWRVWNRELQIRRDIICQPQLSWPDLVRSYRRCNAVLPLAPQRWLRRLCVLIDGRYVEDVTYPGQWLYAIWNPLDGRIYWGQTGAIREARSVIDRFQGEMASARSWRTLYKGKLKGPTLLQMMHALGVENFVVVPVRRSTRLALDALETHFIKSEVPNLNDRRVRKEYYYRFLVRDDMLKKLAHSEVVSPDRWLRLPTLKRLTIHPGDAIRILTAARKALPRQDFVPLQQQLIPYVARHRGIHLPYTLALPLPTQSHRLCSRVSKAFCLFLKGTRLPRLVQVYLASMPRVVSNPVCKLGGTLIPATIDLSISDMIATLRDTQCCGCGEHVAEARHCQHQLLFFPDEVRKKFGESHTRILTTRANAYTRPGRDLVHTRARATTCKPCVNRSRRVDPFPSSSVLPPFTGTWHRIHVVVNGATSRRLVMSGRSAGTLPTTEWSP